MTLCFFIIVIITGIVALVIIYQFIKIFQNLKNNILFCYDNSKRLNIVSNSCFILSSLYLIILIFLLLIMNKVMRKKLYIYVFAFFNNANGYFCRFLEYPHGKHPELSGIRSDSGVQRHRDGRSCGFQEQQVAAASVGTGSHQSEAGRCGTGITGNRHLPTGTAGHRTEIRFPAKDRHLRRFLHHEGVGLFTLCNIEIDTNGQRSNQKPTFTSKRKNTLCLLPPTAIISAISPLRCWVRNQNVPNNPRKILSSKKPIPTR